MDKNASLPPVNKNGVRPEALLELGFAKISKGHAQDAIDAFEQAMAHEDYLTCSLDLRAKGHMWMATALKALFQHDRALEYSFDSLRLYREAYAENSIETALAYAVVGHVYGAKGQYKLVLENYEKALAIRRFKLGDNHPLVVQLYEQMLATALMHDDIHGSLDFAQRVLTARRATVGERHVDTAKAYEALGLVYRSRGGPRHTGNFVKQPEQYERAAQCLEKARRIFFETSTYGWMHMDVLRVGMRLAGVIVALVDAVGEDNTSVSLDDVEGLVERAEIFHMAQPPVRSYEKATFHYERGKIYTIREQPDKAMKAFGCALQCYAPENRSRNYDQIDAVLEGEVRMCLTSLYEEWRGQSQALKMGISALELYHGFYDEEKGYFNVRPARAHMAIAHVYFEQKQFALAMEHTEHAIRIYIAAGRNVNREKDPEMAAAYAHMALVGDALGRDWSRTLQYLRKALGIYSQAVGEAHLETALIHTSIGDLYVRNDQREHSEHHYLAAYVAYKKLYGESHEKTAEMCFDYATTLKMANKLDVALKYFLKAIAMRRRISGPNHLFVGHAACHLATLQQVRGNLVAAIEYYREAHGIYCVQYGRDHILTNDAVEYLEAAFEARTQQLM